MQTYYLKLWADDIEEKSIKEFELAKGKGLDEQNATGLAATLLQTGYRHKDSEVEIISSFSLYPPSAIRMIKLIPDTIVQVGPTTGLKLID